MRYLPAKESHTNQKGKSITKAEAQSVVKLTCSSLLYRLLSDFVFKTKQQQTKALCQMIEKEEIIGDLFSEINENSQAEKQIFQLLFRTSEVQW